MRMALIDGDIFTRRYTAACEYDLYTCGTAHGDTEEIRGRKAAEKYIEENDSYRIVDSTRVVEPVRVVKRNIINSIETILENTTSNECRIFLGEQGVPTFRHKLYPDYKKKRVDTVRPAHYAEIYDWLKEKYNAETHHEMEADDALCVVAGLYDDCVICSNDKDLLQYPGKHYNWITDVKKSIGSFEGDRSLFTQILMGDSVDCIPGLKGVGAKKAQKILEDCTDFQQLYASTLTAYEGDVEHMMLMGSLVYLLRVAFDDSFAQYLERNGITNHSHHCVDVQKD